LDLHHHFLSKEWRTMNERLKRCNIMKAMRTTRIPESTIQSQCEQWLAIKGITVIRVPDAVLAEIHRVGSPQARAMVSRHFCGQPDLIMLLPNGKWLCIELKAADGKLSQGQTNWWKRLGIAPVICRSLDELIDVVEKEITNKGNENG
jgi:hypothetical protein